MQLSPFTRNFMAVYGTLIGGSIVRFLYVIVLARMLGPAQYGTFAYGLAFYGALIVVANFGQHALLATRIKGRRARADLAAAHSLTITLVSTALSATAGLAFVWLTEERVTVAVVVTLMVGAMVGRNLAGWVRHCAIALEDASWLPRYEIAFRAGEATVGTLLLLSGGGLLTVCAVHLFAWVIEAGFAFRRLRRQSGLRFRLGLRRHYLFSIARLSVVFTASFGLFQVFTVIGILLVGFWQSNTAVVGFFALAMQFFTAAAILPLALGLAATPAIGRVRVRAASSELTPLSTIVKAAIVAGGFTAIIGEAYGPWLIAKVFGAHFAPAGEALTLIFWGFGPYAVAIILGQALNALDGHRQAAAAAVLMLATYGAAFALLMPQGAMFAAAVSLVLGGLAGCVVTVMVVSPRIGLSGSKWWLHPLATVALIGTLMRLDLMPNQYAAPIYIGILALFTWRLRIISKKDFEIVQKYFVFRS